MDELSVDLLYEVGTHLVPFDRYSLFLMKKRWYLDSAQYLPSSIIIGNTQLNLDQRLLLEKIETETSSLITVDLPPRFGRSLLMLSLMLKTDKKTLLMLSKQRLKKFLSDMNNFLGGNELPPSVTIAGETLIKPWEVSPLFELMIVDDAPNNADWRLYLPFIPKIIVFDPHQRSSFKTHQITKIVVPIPLHYPRITTSTMKLNYDHGLHRCDELIPFLRNNEHCTVFHCSLKREEVMYLRLKGCRNPLRRYNQKVIEPSPSSLLLDTESLSPIKLYRTLYHLLGPYGSIRTRPTHVILAGHDELRLRYRSSSFELYEEEGIPIVPDSHRNYLRLRDRLSQIKDPLELSNCEFQLLYQPKRTELARLVARCSVEVQELL